MSKKKSQGISGEKPEVIVDEPGPTPELREALADAHANVRAELAESYERTSASMSTPGVIAPTLGQIAFEAYNESKGGLTYDGKPIPPWHELSGDREAVHRAWEVAAAAVRAHEQDTEARDVLEATEAKLHAALAELDALKAERIATPSLLVFVGSICGIPSAVPDDDEEHGYKLGDAEECALCGDAKCVAKVVDFQAHGDEIAVRLQDRFDELTVAAAAPTPAAPSGPSWLGWVVCSAPAGDVMRRPVVLPESVLEQYATGPATSPDMRRSVAQKIAAEMSSDGFFDRMLRAKSEA